MGSGYHASVTGHI